MRIKQKETRFAKMKYSKIDAFESTPAGPADYAMGLLIKNGYVVMQSYYVNEIFKLMRSLRELRVEYSLKVVQERSANEGPDNGYYEFTTPIFEDDRFVEETKPESAKPSIKKSPDIIIWKP